MNFISKREKNFFRYVKSYSELSELAIILSKDFYKYKKDFYNEGFKISDVPSVLKLMITKCHKGGVLSIVDRDMQRVAAILTNGDFNDLDTLNKSIKNHEKFNCFLTISYVESLVQQLKTQDVRVTGREICSSNQFILTLRREN